MSPRLDVRGPIRAAADVLYWRTILRLPPSLRVTLHFRRAHGRFPRLRHPETFSEKIQARKLYEHDERLVRYSDKQTVKEFVVERLGEEWCVPSYFCGKQLPEKMQWPTPFVVKPTHSSGYVRFVHCAEDYEAAKAESPGWLTAPYDLLALGEMHYQELDPRLIVEPQLGGSGAPPPDYKFLVFGGTVKFIEVHLDRMTDHRVAYYDRDWNRQDFHTVGFEFSGDVAAPAWLDEMIEAAEALGRDFSFVRVDLYALEDRPKFGELTFLPGSGYIRFAPPEVDRMLGSLWP